MTTVVLADDHEIVRKGVRSVLRGHDDRPAVAGVHGVLADFVQTEPRFETALEAVLGDRLQTVVVEGHEHGIHAIEYLKSQSEGRGSFLPLAASGPAAHASASTRSTTSSPTAPGRFTMRAAPFKECAARIRPSNTAGVAGPFSNSSRPLVSTAAWFSVSSRNNSSIDRLLKSSG